MYMCLAAWAAEPTLPTLVFEAPAVYPQGALQEGTTGSVLLQLEIDEQGLVASVSVVESTDPTFNEPARQAALSFRFEPARDARGEPSPAIIQYRYSFEVDVAPPLSMEGIIREAGTKLPLSEVSVRLVGEASTRVATTSETGSFSIAGLEPGKWSVVAEADGYRSEYVDVEHVAGTVTQVSLFIVLDRPWEKVADEVEIIGRRVAPELTERRLTSEEIRYLPGTNGDVVKVVQNLPGIARPPLGIGQLLIRGTSPEDSAYYLDGGNVPIVFHFAGLSTVFNNQSVEEVSFMPGNYGVRFGRTLGGVVDIRTSTTLPKRNRGFLSLDLFQTTGFFEQRINDNTALAVSGRRSYIDAVLNPVLSKGNNTVRAPRYYDFQARVVHQTSQGGSLDAMFFLSDDAFRAVGKDADGEDETQFGLNTAFQKFRLRSRESLPGGWQNEWTFTGGPEVQKFAIAPAGSAYERAFTVNVREEMYRAPVAGIGWRFGIDFLGGSWSYEYDLPSFATEDAQEVVRLAPAVYAESTLVAGVATVTPGLRADAYVVDDYTTGTIDPRLAIHLDLGTTTPKMSAGRYSQFPQVREVTAQPNLGPQSSWQTSLGVEQKLPSDVSLEVTGYYNRLTRLVVGQEDEFRFFSGPPPVGPLDTDPYANEGTGHIYGVETMVKWTGDQTTAWFAGTFGSSRRTDRTDSDSRLFEYDQPYIMTALASHQLPKQWRLGSRARLSAGNPYTPVVNRYQNLDRRTFEPIYGPRDSARLPTFWSLDVRVDKEWIYKKWSLMLYLDLQNATNNQNAEVMSWNFDYSQEDPISSIPIVPAFGLQGGW
jgi:TonB family protein